MVDPFERATHKVLTCIGIYVLFSVIGWCVIGALVATVLG